MRSLSRVPSTLLLLLAPISAALPASAQSVDNVVFQHTGPYTSAELLTASGLAPGQVLVHDSLLNAAHQLLDTGLFDDAQILLSGEGKTRTVHVDLKPIPLAKLLPVSFENLVWFTPDELSQAIHARVPLYRGVASDAGNFPDTIQTALQQILAEKGITATLSHAIVEPTTQHPVLAVDFKVERPAVLFDKVTLTGVPETLKADTFRAAARMKDRAYNEGLTGHTFEDAVLAPARNAGYIDARLEDPQLSTAPTTNGVAITFSANLVAGDQYKVSSLTWSPTPLYSAADFARDAKLHPSDLASASALFAIEAAISTVYLSHGYMDVYILSHPVPDTTAHTVAYTLESIPGEVYHLRAVTVTGLSPEARRAFDADWQMKPGDPYSDLAVNDFLRTHIAQPLFRPYTLALTASGDPETHLVDLTLAFTPNGKATYSY